VGGWRAYALLLPDYIENDGNPLTKKEQRRKIMKAVKILFSFVFIVMVVSCGGGGGGGGSSSGGGSSLSCDNNGVPKLSMSADSTAKAGQQFTEAYSWCDSDGDITEVWTKVTLQGRSTTVKFTAAELGISGPSGNQQNKYSWPTGPTGDVFMDFWLKDAKGQVSNTVPLKVTVNAKETSQFKVSPTFGVGLIEKVLEKIK
jgi:hypothetical protein